MVRAVCGDLIMQDAGGASCCSINIIEDCEEATLCGTVNVIGCCTHNSTQDEKRSKLLKRSPCSLS